MYAGSNQHQRQTLNGLTLTHQRPCHLLPTVMPVRVELVCRQHTRLEV